VNQASANAEAFLLSLESAVWNNAPMQAVQVQHYIERATDFSRGMKLMSNDEDHFNSSALLAIHSAISYSDALRAGLGDVRLSSDDHRKAADRLRGMLNSKHYKEQQGLRHLDRLLSKKSRVAYSDHPLSHTESNELITAAERFAVWINQVGKHLNLEGWIHDDQ
jgi:hypothetical protein